MGARIAIHGKDMTVYLNGEIDHHTAREIRETVDAFAQTRQPHCMKLDFSGVTFMDSSGIGLVMGRYRTMSLIGGELYVINIPPHLRRIFSLSGLSALKIIDIERSENHEAAK